MLRRIKNNTNLIVSVALLSYFGKFCFYLPQSRNLCKRNGDFWFVLRCNQDFGLRCVGCGEMTCLIKKHLSERDKSVKRVQYGNPSLFKKRNEVTDVFLLLQMASLKNSL